MRRLLEGVLEESQAEGLNPYDLFMAGLAYSLLQTGTELAVQRVLFVEGTGHDHPFYRREVERVTGLEVRMVFLEDLVSRGKGDLQATGQPKFSLHQPYFPN